MSPLYDHPNFGDVQKHVFRKGIITAVDSVNDTADVTVPGGSSGTGVPLFYHCEPDSEERSNGAIEGAAAAFAVDDEVIVMCEMGGTAVRIIGFVDGIKKCIDGYLLLGANAFDGGEWYTLWDIVGQKVAEGLSWTVGGVKTNFTFPMLADLSVPVEADPEADPPVEAGPPNLDPLYLWLMDRERDEDGAATGLPTKLMSSSLVYFGGGAPDPYTGTPYVVPSPSIAPLSVSCGVGEPSDEDSATDTDVVPARNEWGTTMGLSNTGSITQSGSCTFAAYPGWHTTDFRDESVSNYWAALNIADELERDLFDSAPFPSMLIAKASAPTTYLDNCRAELSYLYTGSTSYTCDHDGGPPCVAISLVDMATVYSYSFYTPIGNMPGISISGEYSSWNSDCGFPAIGIGCYPIGGSSASTLRDPEWGGNAGVVRGKGSIQEGYLLNCRFQTYYYSAAVWSRTTTGGDSEWVWSTVYTGVIASVEYFPDRDAVDADPLEATSHDGFTSAITSLFSSAMAACSVADSSIRAFWITAYN